MLIEGLQIPYGIQPVNPVAVDSWSGPYSSLNEALTTIPIEIRFPTMSVRILDNINGNKLYWFKEGVQDIDLVLFNNSDYNDDDIYNLQTGLTQETLLRISGDTVLNNYITEVENSIGNGQININSGAGLSGSGTFTVNQTGTTTVTIEHADTSSTSNIVQDNSDGIVIQDISILLDTYGHVTGTSSQNIDLDNRYFTKEQSENRYINSTGDTMNGNLTVSGYTTISGTVTASNISGTTMNTGDQDLSIFDGNGVVSGMSLEIQSGDNTKFKINPGYYHIIGVDGAIEFNGIENIPVTNITTQNVTYVGLNITTLLPVESNMPLTPTERRNNIVLGVVVHSNRTTINVVNNLPDVAINALSQQNDFMDGISVFNKYGNKFSANGNNLFINKSEGVLFKRGINFNIDPTNPHYKILPALSAPSNIRHRLSNGTEYPDTNTLDLSYESSLGVKSPIPSNRFAIFRVNVFPSNLVRIQYGSAIYQTMKDAIDGIFTEDFITEQNIFENALLRCLLVVRGGTTNLTDADRAKFIETDRFGQMPVGGYGGTTNLQEAYNNSTIPNILTNSTLDGVEIQVGTSSNTDKAFKVKNITGGTTFCIDGNGSLTGNTLNFTSANIGDVSNIELQYSNGLTGNTQQQLNNIFNSIGNGQININSGSGLSGSGIFTVNQTGTTTVTLEHADTSSASNIVQDNSNGVVIQDISILLDTYGHVTGATASTIDLDQRFVNVTGDTITGNLNVTGTVTGNTLTVNSATIGNVSNTEIQYLDGVTSNVQNQINSVSSSIGNGQITVNSGSGLSGSGTFTVNQTGTTTITLSHADTSSASNIVQDNSNGVVIQDLSVLLDTYGHVTGATSTAYDLDNRYYTESESDNRFVNVTGDTITGDLYVTETITGNTLSVNSANIGNVSNTEIQYLSGVTSNIQTQINDIDNEFTNHKHYNLYQPNGVNPFVYTDNGGNLHIDGNIYQSGFTYETHAEQLYTKKDKIILRDGATSGLSTNEYSGIVAKLYDGANDGQLVFDKDGVARVGDVGSEQPLATRIEDPTNNEFAYWESGNTRLDFKQLTTSDISNINDLFVKETMIGDIDNNNTLFSTSQNYVSGSISIYLNGLKEEFFVETLPNQIQLSEAPTIDYGTSDVVTCTYIRKY